MSKAIPTSARCVIIGGGIIGCSVAYHLSKLGWSDVVLLERKQLTCGTTWHAAGLLGQLRATANLTKLAQYSNDLYLQLEKETGLSTGVKLNGSISVALNESRLEEYKRGADTGRVFGLETELVTPSEIAALYPALNIDGVLGGLYLPNDGQGNPTDITQALAKGARMHGASIFEGVKVTGINKGRGRVSGVDNRSWQYLS